MRPNKWWRDSRVAWEEARLVGRTGAEANLAPLWASRPPISDSVQRGEELLAVPSVERVSSPHFSWNLGESDHDCLRPNRKALALFT